MLNDIVLKSGEKPDRFEHVAIHGGSDLIRQTPTKRSHPKDIGLTELNLVGSLRHAEVYDLHDFNWGAGRASKPNNGTLYDVIVSRIGWQSTDPTDRKSDAGGHGQYLYASNRGGWKNIDTCVFIAGFSWGKIYGSGTGIPTGEDMTSPSNLWQKFRINRSAFVGKAFLIGTEGRWGVHDIHINDSAFVGCLLRMGYKGLNGVGSITNSLLTGLRIDSSQAEKQSTFESRIPPWRELVINNNEIVITDECPFAVTMPSGGGLAMDYNRYYSDDPAPFTVTDYPRDEKQKDTRKLTLAEWQAFSGQDAHSAVEPVPASLTRTYTVNGLEQATENRVLWSKVALNLPDEAPGQIYPHRLPVNWNEGWTPPLVRSNHVHIVRHTEPPETDEQRQIRELTAELDRTKQQLADREQRIRELVADASDLNTTIVAVTTENTRLKNALNGIVQTATEAAKS